MTTRAFRALAIAVVVASATLSGCGQREQPAVVAATEEKSIPAAADADETIGNSCAEDDIKCEERLYQLEETLFAYEAGAAKQIDEGAQSCWKADSDAFRRLVDNCKDFACREEALLARMASLHWLQPEEHRAGLEFPRTPVLLAVLPPATESGSSPPDSKLEFEARGSLIHAAAHPEHMGIAVSAEEKDHVFLFDMDTGNPGQDEVLGLVGTSPTTQVLVRGQRVDAPTGVANFDPSQCRWVYELPRD
jgi:hypothetical protein